MKYQIKSNKIKTPRDTQISWSFDFKTVGDLTIMIHEIPYRQREEQIICLHRQIDGQSSDLHNQTDR